MSNLNKQEKVWLTAWCAVIRLSSKETADDCADHCLKEFNRKFPITMDRLAYTQRGEDGSMEEIK